MLLYLRNASIGNRDVLRRIAGSWRDIAAAETPGEKQMGNGEKDLTGFAALGGVTEEPVTDERYVFWSALDLEPDRIAHVTLDQSREGDLTLHGEGVCAIDLEDGVAHRQLPTQRRGASRRDVLSCETSQHSRLAIRRNRQAEVQACA
jgi:hypothetical protein